MSEAAADLFTIRDFLRFAVSSFRQAKLAHGHGASTALDEAAFLILETLRLPVDDINPWLEARLTTSERQAIADLIRERITTRKPAAYLVNRTYIHGVPFYVDERVIVPRSYIGELMFSGLFSGDGYKLIDDSDRIGSVLDLCTGSGCLAILAANQFRHAVIDAADVSEAALEVARINLQEHDLSHRINLLLGDLWDSVEGVTYDLIITNPPYVAQAEMAEFPGEYAHEPAIAHSGGADGLDIVRRIIEGAAAHLNPGGGLICEVGTGRAILESDYPQLDFLWLDTEESEGEVFWITREQLIPGDPWQP